MTHATLSLAERFATSAPIKNELDNLRRLAGGDPLLDAAAASIPRDAAAKGIPTALQLKQRCVITRYVAWSAACPPFFSAFICFCRFVVVRVGRVCVYKLKIRSRHGGIARSSSWCQAFEPKSVSRERSRCSAAVCKGVSIWIRG